MLLITPVTDLVSAYLVGSLPATAFGQFSANPPALDATRAQAATSAVVTTLKTAGIDFSAVADVLAGPLQPGSSGNAYGQALAALQGKLLGSLSQAVLADAIVRTRPEARSSGTASLPAELLLRPAAPNCVALRSGSYRAVISDLAHPNDKLSIDAPALTLTNPSGELTTLVVDGKCHYKLADGREYAVSDAGVIVARVQSNGLRAAVMFPEQTHALAELAGQWNSLSLETTPDEGAVHAATVGVGADGKVTALTYCGKDAGKLAADCINATDAASGLPVMAFRINATGGIELNNSTDNWTDAVFVYRSGSGDLLQATGGHLSLATLKQGIGLPPMGRVSEYWNLGITTQSTVTAAMSAGKNTVSQLDGIAGTYKREAVVNLASGTTRTERVEINRFRDGYFHRLPEAVSGSDGSAQNVGEFVALGLRGSGMTAVASLGTTQGFSLSLNKSTAP